MNMSQRKWSRMYSIRRVQCLFSYGVLVLLSILVQCRTCLAFQGSIKLHSSVHRRKWLPITRKERYLYNPGAVHMQQWEGDDLRWSTRIRRRLRRRSSNSDATPVRTTLWSLNVLLFFYQIITTVRFIRQSHPDYWPSHAMTITADAVVGSSISGPLIRDFGFASFFARSQPHRYLTSGFFHGGILHLLINLESWRRQPSWLETGLGAPLYLTTFLISIVGGNLLQVIGANNPIEQTLCLGSSGGICGLYGLMYASLIRMGNRGATGRIARGMATIMFASLFLESVSVMSHIGGFLAGIFMAIAFSPSYKKDYSMRRKNSAEYDPAPRDFRQAMGFGIVPTSRGILPLPLLWAAIAIGLAFAKPKFRTMPALVVKGLLVPGSLTS